MELSLWQARDESTHRLIASIDCGRLVEREVACLAAAEVDRHL